jgi:hypothetical protein
MLWHTANTAIAHTDMLMYRHVQGIELQGASLHRCKAVITAATFHLKCIWVFCFHWPDCAACLPVRVMSVGLAFA